MARIKIDLPGSFPFSTSFPVRITDLNYGSHVGNDTILSYIHEARVRFLHSLGYTELDMEGAGLIMSDVAIVFKKEIFYGDEIILSVAAMDLTRAGFDLVYKLEKNTSSATTLLAIAKTGMVCYDYSLKKITGLTDAAKERLSA